MNNDNANQNRERAAKIDAMIEKMGENLWDDCLQIVNSEEYKNLPPPKFPNQWYNYDGQQIEVYLTGEIAYHKWINHNLSLIKSEGRKEDVEAGGSEPDKVIGYVITDIFGLLGRCFGKELTLKIKDLIDDHYERERNERRTERHTRLSDG